MTVELEGSVPLLPGMRAAGWGRIRFDDLHFARKYDPTQAYAQSKLACLMFGLELDKRLRAAGHEAKFWLDPVELAANHGYSDRVVRMLHEYVATHREEWLRGWHDYFGGSPCG